MCWYGHHIFRIVYVDFRISMKFSILKNTRNFIWVVERVTNLIKTLLFS